jgi:hypothetical protein
LRFRLRQVLLYKKIDNFKETEERGWIVLSIPEQGPLAWFCENMYIKSTFIVPQ